MLLTLGVSFGETLYVAVASSMRPLFTELARIFESQVNGVEVKLSFGSSGNLYRQVVGGAPYDIFVSADPVYVERLHAAGKVSSYRELAEGQLVVFTLSGEYTSALSAIRSAGRVAIASPRHAPYGRSALEFLKRSGLYEEVRDKLVYGANASQALQFAISGGADTAIAPLSLVISYRGGRFWNIPSDAYPPVRHTVALTVKGAGKRSAVAFFRFLRSETVRDLIERYGFRVL